MPYGVSIGASCAQSSCSAPQPLKPKHTKSARMGQALTSDQPAQIKRHRSSTPLADVVDDQDTLSRFEVVLHLLRKPPLNRGADPFQSAALVVRLRNELVHYKSRWGVEMASSKLYSALQSLGHKPPPFAPPSMNFFPHRCLSADCGAWALRSVVAFMEAFYQALGVPSRFETYRSRLVP